MATSVVSICNMALGMLGNANVIESLNELSVQARTMGQWYDTARREALSAHDWSFARSRQDLALHAEDPPEGLWTFRYQTPATMLKALRLRGKYVPEYPKVPFELEASSDGETVTLLTDLADAALIYTRDATQVSLYPPGFTIYLARVLAAYTSPVITGNAQMTAFQHQQLERELRRAAGRDANQQGPVEPPDSDMITGR
jgi:hypothetical protein